MLKKTETTAAQTGLPVYIADGNGAPGTDFGSRLSYAVSSVLELGYERVLILPNDVPELKQEHLDALNTALGSQDLICLQDKRGGVAAMGISRNGFSSLAFAPIRWESTHVLSDLIHLYGTSVFAGSVTALSDINSCTDLIAFIQYSFGYFRNWLLAALRPFLSRPFYINFYFSENYSCCTLHFRGPPLYDN